METTTRTDADVQRTVLQELQWTPDVDDAGIGVAVEDGTVALSGEVDSYSERLAVKHAALRVRGVIVAEFWRGAIAPHWQRSGGSRAPTSRAMRSVPRTTGRAPCSMDCTRV